jgi:3-oxoacyl-[acyl-carrier protein] reductase
MNIKGSKVLLTGGSSGIRLATAKSLVEKGANVIISGRDKEKLVKVAEDLGCMYVLLDSSNFGEIEGQVKEAIDMLGGIDVLINNAGIGAFSLVDDVTLDDFLQVYNTNVFGLALISKEVIKHFKAQNKGNIINIGSTAATKGFAHGTVYASSKFAVRGMTECWQQELRKYNVRVMLVNPSEVPTAFNQSDRAERELVDNKLYPEDIAHMIVANLELDDRGFIPELGVWATNPF